MIYRGPIRVLHFSTFVLLLCAITSAADPAVFPKRIPTERVTPATADRLQRVLVWKAATFTPVEDSFWDPQGKIEGFVIDSTDGQFYIQYAAKAKPSGEPAGIYSYDLYSGKLLNRFRIPTKIDMTGQSYDWPTYGQAQFDLKRRKAYVNNTFRSNERAVPNRAVVVEIDLARDDPNLVIEGLHLAPNPNAGDGRLLLADVYATAVAFFDTVTSHLEGPYRLPGAVGENSPRGAFKDHIIVMDQKTRTLCVFKPNGKDLMLVKRMTGVIDCAVVASNVLDAPVPPWLIALPYEAHPAQDGTQSAGQVFTLPDLEPARKLDGYGEGLSRRTYSFHSGLLPRMMQIGRESLVSAIIAEGSPKYAFVFDTETGRRLARLNVTAPPVERGQTAWPVSDPGGLFVGCFSSYWIQAFSVPVEGRAISKPD